MNTSRYIQRIKWMFAITMVLIISLVGISISSLGDSMFFSERFARSAFDYAKYKLEFSRDPGINQIAAAGFGFFSSTATPEATTTVEKALYVPVLVYHRIVSDSDGVNVSLSAFKDHLVSLKQDGYRTITLNELYSFLRGEIELPEKSFVLTFDDGAKDSYYPVDPLLKALNFNAVSFIITGRSLNEDSSGYYLTEEELKKMVKSGRWEIQTHTHEGHDQVRIDDLGTRGNYLSNRMWRADLGRLENPEEYALRITIDLLGARSLIEEKLGVPAVGFTFPFGDYGYQSKNLTNATEIVRQITSKIYPMNFYQIFSGESAANIPNSSNESFYVRRIKVAPGWSGGELLTQIRELSWL